MQQHVPTVGHSIVSVPAVDACMPESHGVRHYSLCAGQADQVVGILKQEGLESQQQQSHAAACLALGSSLALDPDALFEPCMQALRQMLDRGAHDALQPNEIKIFQTPEGMRLCGACSM